LKISCVFKFKISITFLIFQNVVTDKCLPSAKLEIIFEIINTTIAVLPFYSFIPEICRNFVSDMTISSKISEYRRRMVAIAVIWSAMVLASGCNPGATGTAAAPRLSVIGDSLLNVRIPVEQPESLIHYPGFIVSFNKENHVPNYVAWELTAAECESNVTSRKSATFLPDLQIDGCAELSDYRRSGYSRGHMAPAGDMRWSRETMDACFLLTNICPQSTALNGGPWASLEEKCRIWARRDSALVIVCGPVLTDEITQRIGESGVAVPERFFKVILAPYANPPRAIGFIMPNARFEGGMQTAAVTVDEVEMITGMDFFRSLPDEIENKIESECNFPSWSRRRP